ncbi:MAG: 50S ribosomal protein L25 [Dehalococcoidia bacterium]|nr:50S ribosomal protein L25 [Dehalococcoidia bacterium]
MTTSTPRRVDTYTVALRTVLGKRVKRLRGDGVLPGNIYGRGIDSVAVQMAAREARQMLVSHGTNTLIQVQVTGERAPRPVMVRDVRRNPYSGLIQHLDFYQVDLTRAIEVEVPVVVTGAAPAVALKGGVLIHGVNIVHVRALPADVPEHIEISVDGLLEIDQQVTVADLQPPAGVTVLSEPGIMLARVTRPRLAEVAAVPAGAEAAVGAEAPAAEEGTSG